MKKNISISSIIFDFGGVILNIDYNKPAEEFEKLGINKFDKYYSQNDQKKLFDDIEKGTISPEEFREGFKKALNTDISDKDFDFAWNSILLDLPEHRIKLLENVKTNYRIFLLSNTNEIHYKSYIRQLNTMGYEDFDKIFEKAYFSFRMGLRKPDREIFEKVIKDQKLVAEETLFIDDSLQHIESAREIGLQTYFLKNNEDITMLFDKGYKFKTELIINE